MIRLVIKWGRLTLVGTLLLLMLMAGVIAGALFTNPGLNMVLWGVQKVLPQLTVESTKGAIFPSFTLYNTSFVEEEYALNLKSETLTLAVDANCFLLPSVCINQIKVDGLDFTLGALPQSEQEEPSPASRTEDISIPFPISINNVDLTNIALDVLGNKIEWGQFSTRIKMAGRTLTVSPTQLRDINLTLAAALDDSAESDELDRPDGKQPIKLPDVYIPLKVDIKQFDIENFTLEGDTEVVVNHLGVSALLDRYAVDIKQLALDMPEVDLDLQSKITLKSEYPLSVKALAHIKQTDLKGQQVELDASGSVAKLALGIELSEVVKGSISGQLEPLNPDLPFNVAVMEGVAQWPLTGEHDYKAQIAKFTAQGSLAGYQLSLNSKLEGKTIPQIELAASGEGNLNQISLHTIQLDSLGGNLSGTVMANWQAPINWSADLILSNIQPGLHWPEAEGAISGTLSTSGQLLENGGWQVLLPKLDIAGIIRDYPLDLDGELAIEDRSGDGDIHFSSQGLAIKHGANSVGLSGSLDKEWKVDTTIRLTDIEKSVPGLAGQIGGTLAIRGALNQPRIQTSLVGSALAYADMLTISQLLLSGDITPLPEPKGYLELSVKNAEVDSNKIDSLTLSLNGNQNNHQLNLELLSELLSAKWQVQGKLKQTPSLLWSGGVNQAYLSTEQGKWLLDKPIGLEVNVDKAQAKIGAHCWAQESARVCLSQDLQAGDSGKAHLEVNNFAFEQIAMFLPPDTQIEGALNAQAWASWSPTKAPEADIEVSILPGKVTQTLEEPLVIGWNKMLFNAQFKKKNLTADWLIDVADNGELKGNLKLMNAGSPRQKLDAHLVLQQINLNAIQPLLGEYSKVGAVINSDILLSGPPLHPAVRGHFTVDETQVQGEISPIEVKSGKLVLDFSGYQASLNANLETPDGVLSLEGGANWQDLSAWSNDLHLFAQELNVDVPPMVKVKVKPDLRISVIPSLATIEGDIYLPWGRILVEELPPSAISVSSDEVLLDKELAPVDGGTSLPFNVKTQVNIHIGDDFRLEAFGLAGSLVGLMNVSQNEKGPFVAGEVNILNGVYRSFGQDLIIKRGKVLMNGPVDLPFLDIEAIRNPDNTQDNVVAGIRVTGPANEPSISVYSEPAMPQQNALSYLLRGQDIEGSADGNSMTAALIGLSLAKSGKLVGQIGETFGVSDLQLDSVGSGDESQVTVSGYITPDLKVKYGVGIFDSFGEFTVRYRLLKDLLS